MTEGRLGSRSVRMCQRKRADRDRKRPEMGFRASAHGSEEWPQTAALCAVPAGAQRRKKNVFNGQTGGGKLTRREHSFRWGSLKHYGRPSTSGSSPRC
jgi:hypothetical protein